LGSGARGRVRVGARARRRGKGRVRGRVRVRVLLPQALRRARRGSRHRLGVDALDLLRAVGIHRQAVLTW